MQEEQAASDVSSVCTDTSTVLLAITSTGDSVHVVLSSIDAVDACCKLSLVWWLLVLVVLVEVVVHVLACQGVSW